VGSDFSWAHLRAFHALDYAEGYEDLLATLNGWGWWTRPAGAAHIRLLIPAGSRLLDVPTTAQRGHRSLPAGGAELSVGNSDRKVDRSSAISKPWSAEASQPVRTTIFGEAWKLLQRAMNEDGDEALVPLPLVPPGPAAGSPPLHDRTLVLLIRTTSGQWPAF